MRSAVLLLALLCTAAPALAQPTLTVTPSTYVVGPNGTTTVTIDGGTPFQYFALLGSGTNSGFSFAGVALNVGPDVRVLATGVFNPLGQATVIVNPPFPQVDRLYLQAVMSPSPAYFPLTLTSANAVLVNAQEARIFMPVGGAVSATGNLVAGSPGITVSKAGSTYTIAHAGQFTIPAIVPSVTLGGNAGATIVSLVSTADQTVVTLSADSAFWFTLQPVRR